jgi:hypothetical protein
MAEIRGFRGVSTNKMRDEKFRKLLFYPLNYGTRILKRAILP